MSKITKQNQCEIKKQLEMTPICIQHWVSQCNQFDVDGKIIMKHLVFEIADFKIQDLGIVLIKIKQVNSAEIYVITVDQFYLTFKVDYIEFASYEQYFKYLTVRRNEYVY